LKFPNSAVISQRMKDMTMGITAILEPMRKNQNLSSKSFRLLEYLKENLPVVTEEINSDLRGDLIPGSQQVITEETETVAEGKITGIGIGENTTKKIEIMMRVEITTIDGMEMTMIGAIAKEIAMNGKVEIVTGALTGEKWIEKGELVVVAITIGIMTHINKTDLIQTTEIDTIMLTGIVTEVKTIITTMKNIMMINQIHGDFVEGEVLIDDLAKEFPKHLWSLIGLRKTNRLISIAMFEN